MKGLFLAALCMALAITPIHVTRAEEAVETTKETTSITDQAVALYDAEDYDNAVPLLQEAADQGDPVAQNKLGNCYTYGWGVEQDYEEALKWYHLAADQGYPNSLEQDYDLAVKYFKEAAEKENRYALFNLGMCYQDGTGVEKDIEKAAELYQRALDYGYEPTEEEKPRVEEVLGNTPLVNP